MVSGAWRGNGWFALGLKSLTTREYSWSTIACSARLATTQGLGLVVGVKALGRFPIETAAGI